MIINPTPKRHFVALKNVKIRPHKVPITCPDLAGSARQLPKRYFDQFCVARFLNMYCRC